MGEKDNALWYILGGFMIGASTVMIATTIATAYNDTERLRKRQARRKKKQAGKRVGK